MNIKNLTFILDESKKDDLLKYLRVHIEGSRLAPWIQDEAEKNTEHLKPYQYENEEDNDENYEQQIINYERATDIMIINLFNETVISLYNLILNNFIPKYYFIAAKALLETFKEPEIKYTINLYEYFLNKKQIPQPFNNIEYFKTYESFKQYISSLRNEDTLVHLDKSNNDPITLIAENKEWVIYLINSFNQGKQIADKICFPHVRWCITVEHYHYEYYTNNGENKLFFILNKHNTKEKYALILKPNNHFTVTGINNDGDIKNPLKFSEIMTPDEIDFIKDKIGIKQMSFKLLKDQYKIAPNNQVVYRILYSDGKLGGFLEKEDNLDIQHGARVWNEAMVYDNAEVYGNATIQDDAEVFEGAHVYDNAHVLGRSRIYGAAHVFDGAKIVGNAQIRDYARIMNNAVVADKAKISDSSEIRQSAYISDNASVTGFSVISGETLLRGNIKVHNSHINHGIYEGNDIIKDKKIIKETINKLCIKLI